MLLVRVRVRFKIKVRVRVRFIQLGLDFFIKLVYDAKVSMSTLRYFMYLIYLMYLLYLMYHLNFIYLLNVDVNKNVFL